MPVVINETAMARFLNSPAGPIGREITRRAGLVAESARFRSSGAPRSGGLETIGKDSGALNGGISNRAVIMAGGVYAETVSTTANRNGFNYPAFHDISYAPGRGGGAGEPHGGQHQWLTAALRDVFPL